MDEHAVHIFNRLIRFCTSSVLIMLIHLFPVSDVAGGADTCTLTTSSVYSTAQQAWGSAACSSKRGCSCNHHPVVHSYTLISPPLSLRLRLHNPFITPPAHSLPADSNPFFASFLTHLSRLCTSPTSAVGADKLTKDQKLQRDLNGRKRA